MSISPQVRQRLRGFLDGVFRIRRRIDPRQGVLWTFDDGPHPEITPPILDTLARHGQRGLFFVTGNFVEQFPALTLRIRDEGHEIANHTYSHNPYDYRLRSLLGEIRRCQEAIQKVTGQLPNKFRSPCGQYSLGSLLAPHLAGLEHMLWSAGGEDWRIQSRDQALRYASELAESIRPGDIVLLHDNMPYTPALFEALLAIRRPAPAGATEVESAPGSLPQDSSATDNAAVPTP